MGERWRAARRKDGANAATARFILLLAGLSVLIYGSLALAGDLRQRLVLYLPAHALLLALAYAAWRLLRTDHRNLNLVLGAALAFRLVAALGPPALSEDVYRYVWDGRVQLSGTHPYVYAPDDPTLAPLRDANWARINHPEVKTIYPPLGQMVFLALAAVGAGPAGFKLAMALADFGVVWLLGLLLGRLALPRDRLILYAWNPLAVIETAGSGHLEPLGVLLLLASGYWMLGRRTAPSTLALAASIHVKLLPLLLLPGHLRRGGWTALVIFALALGALFLPYALDGPAMGGGLAAYAERWEHNAFVYGGLEGLLRQIDTAALFKPGVGALERALGQNALPWHLLYRYVWPREVARMLVGIAAVGWALWVGLRRRHGPTREQLLVIGGVLLLSPTLHPWYVLWILPLAAVHRSWGWLLLGATIPLAYLTNGGDVSWTVKSIEYLPALGMMIWGAWRGSRRGRGRAAAGVC